MSPGQLAKEHAHLVHQVTLKQRRAAAARDFSYFCKQVEEAYKMEKDSEEEQEDQEEQ